MSFYSYDDIIRVYLFWFSDQTVQIIDLSLQWSFNQLQRHVLVNNYYSGSLFGQDQGIRSNSIRFLFPRVLLL